MHKASTTTGHLWRSITCFADVHIEKNVKYLCTPLKQKDYTVFVNRLLIKKKMTMNDKEIILSKLFMLHVHTCIMYYHTFMLNTEI